MTHWEHVKTIETAQYCVDLDVAPDDDLDLSWDTDKSTYEGLASGLYVAFVARVQVVHKATGAILGADYLSGCIYESAADFVRSSGYFRSMVSEACRGAREQAIKLRAVNLRAA